MARSGVCAVPEGRGIFPNLTVRENLRIWTYRGGLSVKDVEDRTFAAFPRLKERRSQMAGTLSGGEQQMLAISRALVTDPKVLLLDELSMGLAPLIVSELYELVGNLGRQGMTILLVEQFVTTALSVATRAAIMVHGRIQQEGTPERDGRGRPRRLPVLTAGLPAPEVTRAHSSAASSTSTVRFVGLDGDQRVHPAGVPQVVLGREQGGDARRRVGHGQGGHRRPHGPLGRRLGLTDPSRARRRSPRAPVRRVDRSGGRRRRARRRSATATVWMEPACHHDHTSSVTKGRMGASRRSSTDRAAASAARAEAVPAAARCTGLAVGPGLDQLEVVVAERPEEGLGPLEGPGVVVPLEGRGGLVHHRARRASMARSMGAVTDSTGGAVTVPSSAAIRPRANREALSTLMARRRPTFIWPSSTAVSVPGRPPAAQ